MEEVRLYAIVRYRMRKHRLGYNAYDLLPARTRLLKMEGLAKFQFDLRMGGHQILGISRITKEEYENEKREMRKRKLEREVQKTAAEREIKQAHLQAASTIK